MHHIEIILVKAKSREEARASANEFIDRFQEELWDWHAQGGRWTGVLNNFMPAFREFRRKILNKKEGDYTTDDEIKSVIPQLQAEWERLGGAGENAYARNPYRADFDDDIRPLPDCAEAVRFYAKDQQAEADKCLDLLRKAIDDPKSSNWTRAYHASDYSDWVTDRFNWESSVYDASRETHAMPEDPTGYWAVVFDIHN